MGIQHLAAVAGNLLLSRSTLVNRENRPYCSRRLPCAALTLRCYEEEPHNAMAPSSQHFRTLPLTNGPLPCA